MKKVILLVLTGLFCGSLLAQEAATLGSAEKNAANAALRSKNFKEAFLNLEKYLEIVNYQDKASVYNVAFAAKQIKNHIAAEKYFDMSVKNNYKTSSSYLGKAQAQEAMNKDAEMLKTLEQGLQALPKDKKLEAMYGKYFLKEGVAAQQANNVQKASEFYLKVKALNDVELKTTANIALSKLFFNDGATIMQKATPQATTNKALYDAEKLKAVASYKKALDYVNEAQKSDPENQEVKDLLAEIQKAMK